ncbi:NAD(P)-binding Rossmann-fold superfamily protein [Euphorbia peplus]|nr:NAD(P)-binding Rossmann-fold superfamily protein [Euphorbia peplus]
MWSFDRKGPSGFSGGSTAEEVTQGIDGTGLTAIVTGASNGIGMETARVLAMRDLSSMASVRKFASAYISSGRPLNILINNAGIAFVPFTLSEDNIELHFATNYIGHFLLTYLLLDTMKNTTQESNQEGRIVNVSTLGDPPSYPGGIRFDRLNDPSGYTIFRAYGQSKLANVLHANELARRFKEDGVNITANSLNPGPIRTNILNHDRFLGGFVSLVCSFFLKNCQQGAATTCYVALHPQVKGFV